MKKINVINSSPISGLSRRKFIQRTTLAAGAAFSFPYVGNVLGANDRINVACIGCGGKGDSDTTAAKNCGANIVAPGHKSGPAAGLGPNSANVGLSERIRPSRTRTTRPA